MQEVYGGRKEDATRVQELMSSFMRYGRVDIGIYVANGVPDASQKADFDQLAKYAAFLSCCGLSVVSK